MVEADGSEIRLVREGDGAVAELVLARPAARNALTAAMGVELERLVAALDADRGVRVVLVRGEGRAFSAGGDFQMLEERTQRPEAENREAMRRFYTTFLAVRAVRVPTIAVLSGAAVGAGLCLALACDLRVAAAGTKLAANFVRVGLHPGMGASWLLPRLVGHAAAAELLLTGRTIDADEALRLGLVSAVHAPDALEREARRLAADIAAAAPLAVARTKATLAGALGRSFDEALDVEAAAQAADFATGDMKEAIRAFHERRPPRFSGA